MNSERSIPGNPILLPTAYFPPVSYYALLLRKGPILIEQMETFPKQTYRNRCEVLTVSGITKLVVPVSKPNGNHTLTADIRISYRETWQRNQWRTLKTAYSSSPFFAYYSDLLHGLFESGETSLIRYNLEILRMLNRVIGIDPDIRLTDDYDRVTGGDADLRILISPKKGSLKPDLPRYPQVFEHLHGFIGGLSILDLLLNVGPETRHYLESLSVPILK